MCFILQYLLGDQCRIDKVHIEAIAQFNDSCRDLVESHSFLATLVLRKDIHDNESTEEKEILHEMWLAMFKFLDGMQEWNTLQMRSEDLPSDKEEEIESH